MFKKLPFVCAFTALLSTNVYAQNSVFEGLSVGANTEFKSTTIELSTTGGSFAGFGQQNTGVSISADYGVPISYRAILLFGGKIDLTDTTIIKIDGGGSSATIKEKNHYSVFLAPSVIINNTTLGYVKLSYDTSDAAIEVSGVSVSEKYSGLGYGAGLRTQYNGRWYANIEAIRVVFNPKSISALETKTGSTVAAIGLTYKF